MTPTKSAKPVIFLAGHRGMVGSAIARRLQASGRAELLTATRAELDLLDQPAVNAFFRQHRIDQVIIAAACLHVLNLDAETYQANTQPMCSHINVGTGMDVTIRELAETLARVTGYAGALRFDPRKPDGPPRKLLDVSRVHRLCWRAAYGLEEGLRQTYGWFCAQKGEFRQ